MLVQFCALLRGDYRRKLVSGVRRGDTNVSRQMARLLKGVSRSISTISHLYISVNPLLPQGRANRLGHDDGSLPPELRRRCYGAYLLMARDSLGVSEVSTNALWREGASWNGTSYICLPHLKTLW